MAAFAGFCNVISSHQKVEKVGRRRLVIAG